MNAYNHLHRLFGRLSALEDAGGLLSWDRDTMMPEGASGRRATVMATLGGLQHEMLTAPEVADWLETASADGDVWKQANLSEMKRIHARAVAVPGDLVEALSKAGSEAEMIWRKARVDNDFGSLLPSLQTVLDLTRESATAMGEALSVSPYDALLDGFDPGMTQDAITPIFETIARDLPPLLQEVLERQKRTGETSSVGNAPFPIADQEKLGVSMMRQVGFDMARGRLDVSAHPFCGGATDDVRITTRYEADDFLPAFLGVMHETGHALYEQGLPTAWQGQPVGRARGMTLHESQSLLMEMQVTRSRSFATFAAPVMASAFGERGSWNPDVLYRRMTRVSPGFIRVDADEVTYPAHIIVRYELEVALIEGRLALKDLPDAFNARIKDMLGLDVPDDRRGCLQDIHWPLGLWGYFPCYALGALTAAQLFAAAKAALPDIEDEIQRGEFGNLLAWLRVSVHERGSSASTQDIISAATGKPLGAEDYLRHVRLRYVDGER
ncbi:carboxypeptidase M32 [Acetobacter sp.]|jgi:carboxypeptidase Taq|uniref:carboxypeptidase M32 n=1 Tax=Acetobacter sp. TaxID=440 RepID=UPI0025C4499E|nr:carboxypeptidase M32 [Acetobacter sp.]MCH4089756.1 carboxypeptidase M32 [Acetobacter sp.]MCI1298452.1 carboxypeptidase M32 [Acetobacter sp.]MCI1316407.1 carboxypeptidase M32 [Acetobacter sp.]